MRRGIGRLRAGGSGFSPSQIAFTSGLWLDQSDAATGFQDSAGTIPLTASGQQVGKRLDKSGNSNHVLQAGASARPEWDVISGISSDFTDGVNDGYSTATFIAGTLTADMDCFVAVKRDSAAKAIVASNGPSAAEGFGVWDSAGTGSRPDVNSGTPTYWVNGVSVAADRALLNTAVTNGSWVVLEIRDLNLSAWTQFSIGLYTSFMLNADMGQVILCPAQSAAIRSKLRTYCGAKVGLSL